MSAIAENFVRGSSIRVGGFLHACRLNLVQAALGGQSQSQYPWWMKQPCVYILASRRNGTLYTGVTSSIIQRVWQHKNNLVEGFTKKYGVHTLVWFELHVTMLSAIEREKAIKEWRRSWKLALIESANPQWRDLYGDIV
ncbi:GIY-YIG nuclease family protein [Propionivibrio sp.]|uniref:GIY-YIG nuclease family protein n=1 Tax=Propionivibrio sp. TaxID=2212460 RepID=UPI003BEFB161